MRPLHEVIKQIQKAIPQTEVELQDELKRIDYNLSFAAPETHKRFWFEVAKVFEDKIGDPTVDWQFAVRDIFSGKTPLEVQ